MWIPPKIHFTGMQCEAHGAQAQTEGAQVCAECTFVHEDCEHRATKQCAREMNFRRYP
jgi:hypothetical protein